MPAIDWDTLLRFTVSPWELFLRGSVIYWFIFLAFRVVIRRDLGTIAITDMLLVMLIADAAQNAMAAEYRSLPEGIVLVSTILGWNVLLDWAASRSTLVRRLVVPRAVMLVRNGTILRHNLRREFLSEDELAQKLREHDVDDIRKVKAAYMESDGNVSILKRP